MTVTLPANDDLALTLIGAIEAGDVSGLQRLLAGQPGLARIYVIDSQGVGRTLLHILADWPGHRPNSAEAVAALVAAGADLNARILNGPLDSHETPLHWAASSDDVDLIDALLDAGADIEASGAIFTGGTPMSDAVVFAQWSAARRLHERGASKTLWQAAALGLLSDVEVHVLTDPGPTSEEITNALWNACRGGQIETARYLIDRGADLNWVGHDGKTPLDAARESGAEDLIRWLESHDAQTAGEHEL